MKSLAAKFMPAQGLEGRAYYAVRGRGRALILMFTLGSNRSNSSFSRAFGSAFTLRNAIKGCARRYVA